MPLAEQHFIIEGKHLGIAQRELVFSHADIHAARSYAFVCPVCGDLWAKCPVLDGAKEQQYMVWTKACRKHPRHGLEIPGSLQLSWEQEFTEAFPEAVVKWELDRHLDFAERS